MKILYLPNSKCQQRQFEKPNFTAYPVVMAMEAEWYRKQGHYVQWNVTGALVKDGGYADYLDMFYDKVITEPEGLPFLDLPKPDRVFTSAMDKKYQDNGNFKYLPGTYIQSASGCVHGKCSFCIEKDKPYLVRPVDSVIEEIEECKSLGVREIFDDSATFPTGGWLDDFCDKFAKIRGDMHISCNLRLCDYDYDLLYSSGFRMVLFGVESANEQTLEKINKGVKVEDIIPTIKKAASAGIEPHIAVMFGYPWETDQDSINTLRLVHYLLKKGYAKTAQASYYSVKEMDAKEIHRKYVRMIYDVAYSPSFWITKIRDIHNVDDLKYLWRAIKKGIFRD